MVLVVYTHSMETTYLSLRAHVAVGTFFMKSPVVYRRIHKKGSGDVVSADCVLRRR